MAESPPRPSGSAWARLTEALGAPNVTPEYFEQAAAARAQAGAAPGRADEKTGRRTTYASSLEAGIDGALWRLELERRDAETRYAKAVADVRGSRQAINAALAELESLKHRLAVATALAPLGTYFALREQLQEARRELADIAPDPPRYEPPSTAPEPLVSAGLGHPFNADDPRIIARKYELRQAAKASAILARETPYSLAKRAFDGIASRLAAWESANPRIVAKLAAEREATVDTPVIVFEDEPVVVSDP